MTPARPSGSIDLGPAEPGARLTVEVVLSPSHPRRLRSVLSSLYDPASSSYRHWLTPSTFAESFAPSSATLAEASSWLQGRGLTVTRKGEFSLSVTASAGQLAGALGTGFERFRSRSGASGLVARQAPLVPAGIANSINSIVGLDTFLVSRPHSAPAAPGHRRPDPQVTPEAPGGRAGAGFPAPTRIGVKPPVPGGGPTTASPAATTGSSTPQACPAASSAASTTDSYTLDQLGQSYGIDTIWSGGLTGHNQAVAVYELSPYSASDVSAYESCFGLANPVSRVVVDGGGSVDAGGTAEADLDIEQVSTQAPGSSVIAYEGPNTPTGALDTWSAIVSADAAKVISTSWGYCEADAAALNAISQYAPLFQQAAAQGQTILSASGDSGSEDCYPSDGLTTLAVDYPSSDPLVTAVGGTDRYSPGQETVWNDCGSLSCALSNPQSAGGGGLSQYEPRPSFQSSISTVPSSCSGSSCRAVPDISANAGIPMVVYAGGSWGEYMGTSLAAPFVAGLVADRNQGCSGPTGDLAPALYGLVSDGTAYAAGLNDITSGNNDMTGTELGNYHAGTGYDLASGLGSPNPAGLTCPEVESLSVTTAPVGTTVTISGLGLEGATISFGGATATVTASSATSATVTVPAGSGTVTVKASSVLGVGTQVATFGYSSVPTATTTTTTSTSTIVPPSTTTPVPPSTTTTLPPSTTTTTSTSVPPSTTTTTVLPPSCANLTGSPLPNAVGIAAVVVSNCDGYFVTDSAGAVSAFGSARTHGDLSGLRLADAVISITATSDGQGYWLLAADGGVFTFGDARFYGSTGNLHLKAPVVGMAVTPDNRGYWIVAKDGGVFTFGDARFYGSTGGIRLTQPIDGIAVAPGGSGYWLVAADGGVFTFTPDGFYGSLGRVRLAKPIVGMSSTPDGRGYTLVGSDGGVFTFGDARFYGSLGSYPPRSPVVDLSPAPSENGYYLVTSAGAVYAFGPGARYLGSV